MQRYNVDFVAIAETMYNKAIVTQEQELPDELLHRLETVDRLCGYAGGVLGSRQVIAVVVEQYIRESNKLQDFK